MSVFLSAFALFSSAMAVSDRENSKDNFIIVTGTGYPPIKAVSVAQAHLMAKRAAIIDAYRNALISSGEENFSDNNLYTGLSGFVSGLTIIDEEYLEDGGIRIRARIPEQNISVSSHAVPGKLHETRLGPIKVSMEQWYKIINKLVKIEK